MYEILGTISVEWSMRFWDPFLLRVGYGFIGAILKCEI